jgi:hypothetical protein
MSCVKWFWLIATLGYPVGQTSRHCPSSVLPVGAVLPSPCPFVTIVLAAPRAAKARARASLRAFTTASSCSCGTGGGGGGGAGGFGAEAPMHMRQFLSRQKVNTLCISQ